MPDSEIQQGHLWQTDLFEQITTHEREDVHMHKLKTGSETHRFPFTVENAPRWTDRYGILRETTHVVVTTTFDDDGANPSTRVQVKAWRITKAGERYRNDTGPMPVIDQYDREQAPNPAIMLDALDVALRRLIAPLLGRENA